MASTRVDEPLLFHTGARSGIAAVTAAIAQVMPVSALRFVAFSHVESDECGAMNALLAMAPRAVPLCGQVGAMVNGDLWDRPPRALGDGETLSLGARTVRWLDAPHLPHAWDCGYLFVEDSRTLLCGDLFTQGGDDLPPVTSSDILGPSEAFRRRTDYFAHASAAWAVLGHLAEARPSTLGCMHGSAWQGDGSQLLRALADELER